MWSGPIVTSTRANIPFFSSPRFCHYYRSIRFFRSLVPYNPLPLSHHGSHVWLVLDTWKPLQREDMHLDVVLFWILTELAKLDMSGGAVFSSHLIDHFSCMVDDSFYSSVKRSMAWSSAIPSWIISF